MSHRSLPALFVACFCCAALAGGCASPDPAAEKAESIRKGDAHAEARRYGAAVSAYRAAVRIDPRDGALRRKLADAYQSADNWSAATDEAMRAADLLPGDYELQLRAVDLMNGQHRFVDARDRAAALLERKPDDVRALIRWAYAVAHVATPYVALESLSEHIHDEYRLTAQRREIHPGTAQSDEKSAEDALRRALRLEPDSFETQLALVNFLWITGRPDAAEPLLRAMADASPEFSLLNYALGTFYLARGRGAEAERYLKAAAGDEERAAARFALADYYILARRDADAATLLTSMLQRDDKPARDVTIRLARVEWRSGRRDAALARVDDILAGQPAHAEALLLKAQFHADSQAWDRALPLARAALAQSPASSAAHATLGDVLLATGDLEAANASYAEAFRLDPGNDELPLKLGRLSIQLGRGAEAVQAARDAKRRQPNDPVARLALAQALALTGDHAAAEHELAPLVDHGTPSAAIQALLGTVRAGRGNRGGARAAFARALELDPQSTEAIAGLVQLDLQERNFKSARQRVERALATAPDDAWLRLLSADVAVATGELAEAEKTLRHLVQVDENNLEAVMALSEVLVQQRRGEEAEKVLAQFLQRRPNSTNAQTRLAMLLEDGGKLEEARRHYERIVARDRRAARAASRLAALHVELNGNLDVALDLAILAKQQLPRDPAVADTLGWVYVAKNVMGRALPHLRDAVRAAPDNPLYRLHLGQAYLRAGDRGRARDELTKALTLDRNFKHADTVRQLLASMG